VEFHNFFKAVNKCIIHSLWVNCTKWKRDSDWFLWNTLTQSPRIFFCPLPEFIDQFSRKQAQNSRFPTLKTSVLGLFSRKLGLEIRTRIQIRTVLMRFYSYNFSRWKGGFIRLNQKPKELSLRQTTVNVNPQKFQVWIQIEVVRILLTLSLTLNGYFYLNLYTKPDLFFRHFLCLLRLGWGQTLPL
jgi:hypothetical protein